MILTLCQEKTILIFLAKKKKKNLRWTSIRLRSDSSIPLTQREAIGKICLFYKQR